MILDYLTALLPPLRVDSVKDLHRKCGPRWRRVVLTVHGTPIPGWARRATTLEWRASHRLRTRRPLPKFGPVFPVQIIHTPKETKK